MQALHIFRFSGYFLLDEHEYLIPDTNVKLMSKILAQLVGFSEALAKRRKVAFFENSSRYCPFSVIQMFYDKKF